MVLIQKINSWTRCFYSSQAEFVNWDPGQPNQVHGDGQYCVDIGSSWVKDGTWNDLLCSSRRKFICEKSHAIKGYHNYRTLVWIKKVIIIVPRDIFCFKLRISRLHHSPSTS